VPQQQVQTVKSPREHVPETRVRKRPRTKLAVQEEGAQDLLNATKEFGPLIPSSVTNYFLERNGAVSPDERVTKVISMAVHKFISDVGASATRHHAARAKLKPDKTGKTSKVVLTMEDMSVGLREWGFNISKPDFYQ